MPKRRQQVRSHRTETAATMAAPEVAAPKAIGGGAMKAASAPLEVPGQFIQSHSAGGVLVSSLLLLTLATWAGFGKPTLNAMWNPGTTWSTPIDGKLILGGVAFCLVMAMLAESSNDAHSLIVWMLVGLWLIFVVMNGSGTIANVFKWFSSGPGSTTANASGTNSAANVGYTPSPNVNYNTPAVQAQINQINQDFGSNAANVGYGTNAALQNLQQQIANISKLFSTTPTAKITTPDPCAGLKGTQLALCRKNTGV